MAVLILGTGLSSLAEYWGAGPVTIIICNQTIGVVNLILQVPFISKACCEGFRNPANSINSKHSPVCLEDCQLSCISKEK